ncbi:MAG: tetratricopeptide repeat protein [Planctomycetota bacterium]|nr:tetratricopeptide repeat protein [Planctomycetota bacterium]
MIRIPFLFGAILIACVFAASLRADQEGDRQRDFLRSLELFDKAKTPEEFRESAKVLETLLVDGYCNGAVYYNLGNAYFRAGDFGRAILNYRKAAPYRPSDSLLEANLQQALASAPGRIAIPPKPWWSPVMFWAESLSYPTRVWLALVLVGIAPLLIFASVLLRRRHLVWVAIGLIILGIVFSIDGFLNAPERGRNRLAVITGETVARKGIGKDYEPAFNAPLKDGAEFIVLDETNGWTFGHFAEIGDGWVKNDFVAR